MRKIPTLFVRDFTRDNGKYVTDEVTSGCEWVMAGEGTATRKYDGTCVMFDGSEWWARREVKAGKTPPQGFRLEEHDETTGKTVGWEPIEQSPFVKSWREAMTGTESVGTYELCGPKVQGNPEDYKTHTLVRHGDAERVGPPPGEEFNPKELVREAGDLGYEGIVWHHPDGRMAKLKVRDLRRD
jgi:hypothetical protein